MNNNIKLLLEHNLESLRLYGGYKMLIWVYTCQMQHCWKSHVTAHIYQYQLSTPEVNKTTTYFKNTAINKFETFSWFSGKLFLNFSRREKQTNFVAIGAIATKVVCFSRLLKCLRSLYGKRCGPRDQTAPIGAVCLMFASILNSSVMLGNCLQQTTSAEDIFRCIFSWRFKG